MLYFPSAERLIVRRLVKLYEFRSHHFSACQMTSFSFSSEPSVKPLRKLRLQPLPLRQLRKRCSQKLRRAYKKADMPNVSEQKKLEFAQELLAAGVPILNRSSARISRAIKGEISIEDLKVPRRAKRNPA